MMASKYSGNVIAGTPIVTTNGIFSLSESSYLSQGWRYTIVSGGTGGLIADYTDPGGTDFRLHKFTSSGTFVSNVAQNIDIILVGGGGAGGYGYGGGGGSGGIVYKTGFSVAAVSCTIVVGAGGTGHQDSGTVPTSSDGAETTFTDGTTTYTAGKGGGGGGDGASTQRPGSASTSATYDIDGGSGGGERDSGYFDGTTSQNTAADTVSGAPGFDGSKDFAATNMANSTDLTAFLLAAQAGTDAANIAVNGSSSGDMYFSGTGAGAPQWNNGTDGGLHVYAGGKGGGGDSSSDMGSGDPDQTVHVAKSGMNNTGGGGGGQCYAAIPAANSGNGGSGIAIIRYAI